MRASILEYNKQKCDKEREKLRREMKGQSISLGRENSFAKTADHRLSSIAIAVRKTRHCRDIDCVLCLHSNLIGSEVYEDLCETLALLNFIQIKIEHDKMPANSIGFTQLSVKKTQFTWKINNFKYLQHFINTGNRLESPLFTCTKPDDGIRWRLFLWPNGVSTSCAGFVSASLAGSTVNDSCQVHVTFSLSAIDNNGKKCYENSKDNSGSIIQNSYDGFNEFLPKKDLETETSNILRNDVLTVYCELTVVYKNSLSNIEESIQQQPFHWDDKFSSAFERQFQKQEFSDVKIVARCGRELPAHKFVLAALSPVFSAMFTNDMAEKKDNRVVVKDLDYDSLREMLRFMYTGKVENLAKQSGGILAVQEKYQIDGLKELCEEYFFQNINVENAVEILALSIRYNIVKIQNLTEKFIQCHAKDVSQSAAFKAIDETDLLAAIVNILVSEQFASIYIHQH